MHLMPFFCQAIPNHLRQFFGCYLGFLHGSVPLFPTNYWASESLQTPPLLFPYFIGYLSAALFVAAPAFFLQPESFVRKCGASVTPREQNNAPAARFGPTQSLFAATMLLVTT
jgi:hypothetical protein